MKSLIIIPLLLLIYACDPGVHFERVVENRSSHDIWIKVNQETYPVFAQDSFMIPKNSSMIVQSRGGLGKVDDFGSCGLETGTLSSGVLTNDTLEIQNDLNDGSYWAATTRKKGFGGGGECECRFIITDGDIK